MEKVLEYLEPKTFNKVHYVAVGFWILISIIFFAIFVDMENSESRFDFRCGGAKSENVDVVRGECYEKYMKQYNKFSFPMFGFVIINFVLIALVCAIYSQIVRSKVDQLSRGNRNGDQEGQLLVQDTASSTGNKLFIAYCSQLSIRIVLGVIFIILQTQLFYPLKFSSKFNCYLTDGTNQPRNSSDNAQNSTLHYCHNQRAKKKTFWMYAVLTVNGILVAGILVETVYLLSRACIERSFMQDSNFYKTHLSLNQLLDGRKFQKFIKSTKKTIVLRTEEILELQPPFLRYPGEHSAAKEFTLDQIYTNLVVIQNRETHDFTENRKEQLKVYPRSREEKLQPKSLEDLLDFESKKFLIVGRPGIGKTLCCIKLLRDWALDEVFKATSSAKVHFNAAFFVKFRRFNSADELSLKDLLIQSEYYPTRHMDDKVWNRLQKNPEGVLMLFDGFDEFEHNENITAASTYPRSIEDKKPLQILYQWLVTGKLLKDALIVTTTRPTALSGIAHLKFDKTFEVLGFSTEQIKEYINKFAGDDKEAGETLWRHISSNMNLLSLCYIPVNSFIMCSSLSEIMRFESSGSVTLPSKLTTIFKIAVKVFYFKHAIEFRDQHFTRENFLSDNLPLAVEEKFEKLGRVAFEGIKEGKLILGGNEVQGMGNSALFHRLPDRQIAGLKDEQQFCFIHLTIQEFFAARHMASDLDETELRNFVSENIKNGKWQLVFQFLAGLMEDKVHLPIEIITDLLPVKTAGRESTDYNQQWTGNEEQRKVTCWPTQDERELAVTLIKCLNENSRMNEEAQRKLQQMNFNCVNFIRCHLTAVDCSSLVNVINVQQISHLDLSGNNFGPLGCLEICKLLKCRESQLSWLNLMGNQLTDEGAKYLAEAINNNNCQLHTLNLSLNNISHIGAQHLAEAINNNNCQLRTLNLSHNNISDIGAQHLAEAINNNNCQLHTLNLTDNDILEIGVKYLAEAINNNNNCQLHILNLTHNNISHSGARYLAEAINNNNCQLHILNLTHNNISHIGARYLAEAINNNNCQLHTLNLSFNNISDIGAQHLADAINNNNCQLHTLDLYRNKISDIGAQHLAKAINNNNCQLRTLNLTHNNISHIGAQHLAEAINNNNCQLHTLDLYKNNISDIGAQHLAEAINNNNCQLHTLDLSLNNISDTGAQHLAKAINNNNCQLHTLDLSLNNISHKARNFLSNSQSQCKLIL